MKHKLYITIAFLISIKLFAIEHNFKNENQFEKLISSYNMIGSILIYDINKDIFIGNDLKRCQKGFLPASTFKIVNSLIGIENGILKDTNYLFKWNGEKRSLPIWEKDMNLKQAFLLSCVPCFQQLAREIGVNDMNKYLNLFDYGKMIVNSENIDKFWLEGESKISQFEQIEFLKKLYFEKLPVTLQSSYLLKELMLLEKNDNYSLYGKTGWSLRNGNNNGWFVGYIETKENVYFFATNIEPKSNIDTNDFLSARKKITIESLKILKFIN